MIIYYKKAIFTLKPTDFKWKLKYSNIFFHINNQ